MLRSYDAAETISSLEVARTVCCVPCDVSVRDTFDPRQRADPEVTVTDNVSSPRKPVEPIELSSSRRPPMLPAAGSKADSVSVMLRISPPQSPCWRRTTSPRVTVAVESRSSYRNVTALAPQLDVMTERFCCESCNAVLTAIDPLKSACSME